MRATLASEQADDGYAPGEDLVAAFSHGWAMDLGSAAIAWGSPVRPVP